MTSLPLHGGPRPGLAGRAARYVRRPELRRHPLRSVGRRAYLESASRLAPGRLGRIHTAVLRGTTLTVGAPVNEPVGRSLFLYGVYEPLASAVFAALLSDGDVAVDVGAHYGDFALLAAYAVGPGGRVLAFEPQGEVRAVLVANLVRNGLNNVDVLAEALSDFEGTAPLFRSVDPLQTGGASLSAAQVGQREVFVEATVRRLDDVLDPTDTNRLVAVKIDVEGEEAAVLRGARATLERARPGIVVEVNGLRRQDEAVRCPALDLLRDLGYRIHGMVATSAGLRLEAIEPGADPRPYREPWLALNVVALVPGSTAERRLQAAGHLG